MAHEKVYVVCEDMCMEEGMTKEQINSGLNSKSDTSHTHDDRYYTESEMNTKLAEKIGNTSDNTTSVNFEKAGTATITRRGNVVTVFAEISIPAKTGYTLSNKVTLPDWAIPSASINPTDQYKRVKSSTGAIVSLDVAGYLLVNSTNKTIALIANNTNETNQRDLTLCWSYVVD